jgi:hypothetical protein
VSSCLKDEGLVGMTPSSNPTSSAPRWELTQMGTSRRRAVEGEGVTDGFESGLIDSFETGTSNRPKSSTCD